MNLLIMGPPGAGKGSQAVLIKDFYNIPHISTGDMFRDAISKQTSLGVLAKNYIDKGELVPDEVTVNIVRERLQDEDCKNGFLLDGFPRTIAQAKELDGILKELNIKIDNVINLVVEDNILISRITGRRVCSSCGATYHIENKKPKVVGICDMCGGALIQRADDTIDTVKNRINVYYKQTEPLLDYYNEKKLVVNINGFNKAIEDIFQDIIEVIGGKEWFLLKAIEKLSWWKKRGE